MAEAVNNWCREREVRRANGQAASDLSARTLHYYRGAGLLDAPGSGAGRSYGQRHFLQLTAIPILQAQGLPLSRIQLLFGRSNDELEQVVESVREIDSEGLHCRHQRFATPETWTTYPVDEQLFLAARDRRVLSTGQLKAIRKICGAGARQNPKAG